MTKQEEILYMSAKERDEFWREYNESRRKLDEELSLVEKLRLHAKLREDARLMKNARIVEPLIECENYNDLTQVV